MEADQIRAGIALLATGAPPVAVWPRSPAQRQQIREAAVARGFAVERGTRVCAYADLDMVRA